MSTLVQFCKLPFQLPNFGSSEKEERIGIDDFIEKTLFQITVPFARRNRGLDRRFAAFDREFLKSIHCQFLGFQLLDDVSTEISDCRTSGDHLTVLVVLPRAFERRATALVSEPSKSRNTEVESQ